MKTRSLSTARLFTKCFGGVLLALCAAAPLSAQTIISTPLEDWGSAWGPGSPGQQSYAQSFIVPATNVVLQDFTFAYVTTNNSQGFDYFATLYAFDGTNMATGSALWTSGVQALSSTVAPFSSPTPATFTPNIELVAGNTYIFILSSAGLTQTPPADTGRARIGVTDTDLYADGKFYYQNTNGNPTNFTSMVWNQLASSPDAAFTATFVAVPEPGTVALLAGAGILGLAWQLRRRKP